MGNDRLNATFAAKWTEEVAQRGFVPIHKCLVTCMGDLGLKPQEVGVLGNIIEKCWFVGEKSWKKVDTMATDIGRCNSTIRAITKSLEEKRFIVKEHRFNTSNLYDPTPTGQRIQEHLPSCRYYSAEKLKAGGQNTSVQVSQNTSDYIEPELLRTNNIQLNKVQDTFSNLPNIGNELRFLELINKYTNSNYRYLPKEAKETLKLFSLEEIDKALQVATVDSWHKDKLQELSVNYLCRASTIDNLLSRSDSKEINRTLKLKQLHEANMDNQAKLVEKEAVGVY